jgi:hypothetical protein
MHRRRNRLSNSGENIKLEDLKGIVHSDPQIMG